MAVTGLRWVDDDDDDGYHYTLARSVRLSPLFSSLYQVVVPTPFLA